MKRTSYIIIGVILAMIPIWFMIVFYVRSKMVQYENLYYSVEFTEEFASMELENIHTIEFTTDRLVNWYKYISPHSVQITSSEPGSKGNIRYPLSEQLKVSQENGILRIRMELSTQIAGEENQSYEGAKISGLQIDIQTDQTLRYVRSAACFNPQIYGMQLDSLHLEADRGSTDSCTIGSLRLDPYIFERSTITSRKSTIENLYMNMDKTTWWGQDEYRIDTLHLTGSNQPYDWLQEGNYKKLIWDPQTEDGELHIVLKKKCSILIED